MGVRHTCEVAVRPKVAGERVLESELESLRTRTILPPQLSPSPLQDPSFLMSPQPHSNCWRERAPPAASHDEDQLVVTWT